MFHESWDLLFQIIPIANIYKFYLSTSFTSFTSSTIFLVFILEFFRFDVKSITFIVIICQVTLYLWLTFETDYFYFSRGRSIFRNTNISLNFIAWLFKETFLNHCAVTGGKLSWPLPSSVHCQGLRERR